MNGKQCAIKTYKEVLVKIPLKSDPLIANITRKIMEDEVKHEEDLQNLLEDMK